MKLLFQFVIEKIFMLVVKTADILVENKLSQFLKICYRRAYWKTKLKSVGQDAFFHPYIVIKNPDKVSIGNRCAVGEFVHIWGGDGVTVGDDVMIAAHVSITSSTHLPDAPLIKNSLIKKPVIIENNVWIGAHAIILPGVIIKSGSTVAAGAIVTKDVPSNVVVAGVPARIIRNVNRTNG